MITKCSVGLAAVVAILCYEAAHSEEPSLDKVPAWHWLKAGKSYLRIQPPDEATAARYFARAVAVGEPWVLYEVAEIYRKGDRIQKNHPEAVRLYSVIVEDGERCASAQRTCGWAKFQLGEMLRKGEGVPKNIPRARRLLEDAILATGNGWAKLALGDILDDSENPVDLRKAADLYGQAAAEGNTYALGNLRELCQRSSLPACGSECERRSPSPIQRQEPHSCPANEKSNDEIGQD
jgi:TPR repeat protein